MFVFHFVYHYQSLFEVVAFEAAMCECAAYAVFAEAGTLYASAAQKVEGRRGYVAVALEFYYCNSLEFVAPVAFEVVEPEVEVYGKAFGLAVIDKCYAVEPVLDNGGNLFKGVPCNFAKEGVYVLSLGVKGADTAYGNAFLLGASAVVLVLDFEECVVAVEVCAHSNLLSDAVAGMVHAVHLVVVGVEICRMVAGYVLAACLLDVVLPLYGCEELDKLVESGDKLGVGPVHELYARHLLECYRG